PPLTGTLTVSTTQATPGSAVSVTAQGGSGERAAYVGLYEVSKPDSGGALQGNWQYLTGGQVVPPTGVTSAMLTFTMPTKLGTYNFRFFNLGNAQQRLAVSPDNVVQAASPPPVNCVTGPLVGKVFIITCTLP